MGKATAYALSLIQKSKEVALSNKILSKTCDSCAQYQPNWRYCPLVDLFLPPDSSCKEFIAKKDEVKDGE